MKRREIYDRFLTGKHNVYRGEYKCIYGVSYTMFETDTGVKFLKASIRSWNKLPSPYKEVDTEDGRVSYIRFYIPGILDGMPVISMANFVSIVGSEYRYGLVCFDFTESDLSSVLDISIFDPDYYVGYVMLPVDKSKRLKPVSMGGMFLGSSTCRHTQEYIDSVLRNIDLSELVYAERLFRGCDLTEFDFDRYNFKNLEDAAYMFSNCKRLKNVKGSMNKLNTEGERVCVNGRGIFKQCANLEHIGDEVFKNVKFSDLSSMFGYCRKLRNLPLCEDNVDADKHKYNTVMEFVDKCSSLSSIDAGRMLSAFYNLGLNVVRMFDGWKQYIYLGEYTCKYTWAMGLARGTASNIVDASGIRLTSKEGCVIGMVAREGALDDYYDYSKLDYIDMFFNLYDGGDGNECAPEYIIINDTFNVDDIDRRYYDIVDLRGLSEDSVITKFDMMKMLRGSSVDSRRIVIVDTGIKLVDKLIKKGW